jgi:hypothetical protein
MGVPETMDHAPDAAALVVGRMRVLLIIAVLVMAAMQGYPL